MMPRPSRLPQGVAAGLLLTCCCVLPASERVQLRNGFSIACRAHQTDGATTHLELSPGNTMDVPTAEVQAIEPEPEPSAPAALTPSPLQAQDLASSPSIPQLLQQHAGLHHIDVALLESVVQQESGGRVHAASAKGARGLMQLMPGTAHDLGVQDRDVPAENVRGGTTYLDSLLTRYHNDMVLALAAYNAGPAAVDRYHGVPPYRETRAYVSRIVREFNRRVLERERAAASAGTAQR